MVFRNFAGAAIVFKMVFRNSSGAAMVFKMVFKNSRCAATNSHGEHACSICFCKVVILRKLLPTHCFYNATPRALL